MAYEATYSYKGGYPSQAGGPFSNEEIKKLYMDGNFRLDTEITCHHDKGEETRTLEEWIRRDSEKNLFIRVKADESEENIRRRMITEPRDQVYEGEAEERRAIARDDYMITLEKALNRITDPIIREKLLALKCQNSLEEIEMENQRRMWEWRESEERADREKKKQERIEEIDKNARIEDGLREKQAKLDKLKEEEEKKRQSATADSKLQQQQPGPSGVATPPLPRPAAAFHVLPSLISSPQFITPILHPLHSHLNSSLPPSPLSLIPLANYGLPPHLTSSTLLSSSSTHFVPGMLHSPPGLVGVPGYPNPLAPPFPPPLMSIPQTGDVYLRHKPRPQPPGVAKTLESYPHLAPGMKK